LRLRRVDRVRGIGEKRGRQSGEERHDQESAAGGGEIVQVAIGADVSMRARSSIFPVGGGVRGAREEFFRNSFRLAASSDALKAAGAETIYREKVSGVRADRPQLAKLMAALKAGDMVVVTKLDGLGPVNPRVARTDRQGRRLVSVARRSPMGHVEFAGPAALNPVRRHCRLRARPDPRTHWKKAASAPWPRASIGRKRKLSDYQRADKRRAPRETLAAIAQSYVATCAATGDAAKSSAAINASFVLRVPA
jgi:DNA invertase Pin-like site-specific DNA recombinase